MGDSTVTDKEIERWAIEWIEAQQIPKIPTDHPLWWALEHFMGGADDLEPPTPDETWQTILEILHRQPPKPVIGVLAGGPVEDLIDDHGPDFIERIELEARRDPAFRRRSMEKQHARDLGTRRKSERTGLVTAASIDAAKWFTGFRTFLFLALNAA